MQREAYFDNAKLILIFLVVFGHLIQPFIDVDGVRTLYMWIYFFHMPAFILISGFFARGSGEKSYIVNLVKKLLIPYMIFQLTYTAFYFLIGKDSWQTGLFHPQWSLWFLMSLFSWHMLLILFKKINPIVGILLALSIGILIGYVDDVGHYFSLSRTFVFFPFFLIGFWLKKEHIQWLTQNKVKALSLIPLTLTALAIHYLPNFNVGWLLASRSYDSLGIYEYGAMVRVGVYSLSLLMALCVLAWIPKMKSSITYLGTRTLYVYLLHGFFIQAARQFDLFGVSSALDVVGLAGISAAIILILSNKWIISIWQPFIEGRATMLKTIVNND